MLPSVRSSFLLLSLAVLSAGGPAVVSTVGAQGFADDFSRNSLHYTLARREGTSGLGQVLAGDQGLRMSARVVEPGFDELRLTIAGPTDHIVARVVLERASFASFADGEAGVRIEGNFYNDTADPGSGMAASGDIYFSLVLFARADGSRGGQLCASRTDDTGETRPLRYFGEAFCEPFAGFVPEFDAEYRLVLTLDRANGVMTAEIDGLARVVELSTRVYQAHSGAKYLEAFVTQGVGDTLIEVRGVETDNFGDDFTVDLPVFPGYRPFLDFDRPADRRLFIDEVGRARLSLAAPEGVDYDETRLGVWNVMDHLQGRLMLSSESTIEEGSTIGVGLQGAFYRDSPVGAPALETASVGSVQAQLMLTQSGGLSTDGGYAEYCLWRQAGPNGDIVVPLLDQERRCLDMGFTPRVDVPYSATVALDRDAGVIIFSLGEVTRVHNVSTQIHSAPDSRHEVVLFAQGGARGVAYLDDLRTANGALTSAESGLEIVPYIHDAADPPGVDELLDDGVIVLAPDASRGRAGGCAVAGDRGALQAFVFLLPGAAMTLLARRRWNFRRRVNMSENASRRGVSSH